MDLHEVIQPSLQSVKAFLTTNVIIVYQDKLFYVKQSDQFFKPGTYNSLHTRSLCPHATLLHTHGCWEPNHIPFRILSNQISAAIFRKVAPRLHYGDSSITALLLSVPNGWMTEQ